MELATFLVKNVFFMDFIALIFFVVVTVEFILAYYGKGRKNTEN